MHKRLQKTNYGYLFIAPFFIAFILFRLYPILYSLWLSFNSWDGLSNPQFVGLANYARLLQDKYFYISFSNTLFIWLAAAIPQIIFALILAALFSHKPVRGGDVYRAIYYLPNLVTMTSIAILFNILLDWQAGAFNKFLISLHLIKEPINWLTIPRFAQGTVSFIQWWMWFGYSTIIFMAGMKAIPDELYEAAKVDGASWWRSFFSITLPSIKNITIFTVITSIIGGMQIFDVPNVLTNGLGAPDKSILTMVMYLYNNAFMFKNYGYGATVAWGLFLIIMVFSVIALHFMNRGKHKE